ncbi:MAG: hypothetical protein IKB00_10960 [Bacteroidaceae bacterium]|nr:hypothetical protein [Bacteroidaceae bacterium]
MKKNIIKKSFLAASMLLMTIAASAQSASSSYFLEGFSQRYQLNPAFAPDRPVFLAIPGLSNIQVDASSSVGLSNFLFESTSKPGMLTTFMSPDIDAQTFLDGMPKAAQFNVGLNMDILALGVGGKNGFTTFNLKLRNNEQINLPKELFGFMKASLAEGDYLIENININSISYLEASLTHSHKIGDRLTVGLGLKFLEGIAYADVTVNEIDAKLHDDEWLVKSNGTIKASVPGAEYKLDPEDNTFDGIDGFSFKVPQSHGFAVDLGAEYDFKDIVDGLKVSAAITDLGFIGWANMNTFATNNNEYVEFEGFNNYDVSGDNEDETMDQISDDFNDMVKMHQSGAANQKEKVTLNTTLRLGAEYALPFAQWISFGELLTYRAGLWPYTESRTSITLSPCGWFDLSGNACVSSMGSSMGLLVNLHPGGINFFVAVDRLKADFNPQFIPLHDFGLNFSLGLNFAFGKKRDKLDD